MKKTVIALAAMIAASSSALAADVTVYGKVDLGFTYRNADTDSDKVEDFQMDSGKNSGSRWGLKASEDLGDGYAVAVHLESGFAADTGASAQGGRLFGREARLSFETPVATISAGRMGGLTSGIGTFDVFQATGDALDGGWDYNFNIGNWFSRDRYDNMITVNTPNLNGFTLYAQYSFGTDSLNGKNDGVSNNRETERYAAFGVTYENGPLSAGLFLDTVLRQYGQLYKADGKAIDDTKYDQDDAKAVSFAIAYDFDVAKVFFGAQYGHNETTNFWTTGTVGADFDAKMQARINEDLAPLAIDVAKSGLSIKGITMDGYRVGIGATTNLPCGTLAGGVYYGSMKNDTAFPEEVKAKNFNVAIGHTYPFSKRTYSYVGLAYKSVDMTYGGNKIAEEDSFTTQVGLVHSF